MTTLTLTTPRTYTLSAAFILGNLALPQLCHLIPQGGLILLPIYFFTLIGAYHYGRNVGILTALLSPLTNSLLFGMPPAAVLPAIMIKSLALALISSHLAQRTQSVRLTTLALAVATYQTVGMTFEFLQGLWLWHSPADALHYALQDIRLGLPGLLIQIFAGYLILKALAKYQK